MPVLGTLVLAAPVYLFRSRTRWWVALMKRYRAWLLEAKLYDLNLVAHAWRKLTTPR